LPKKSGLLINEKPIFKNLNRTFENLNRLFVKKLQICEKLTPIFVNFSQEISQKSQNEISAK